MEPTGCFFMTGDVSGKGIPASLLMSHLHVLFRSLLSASLPLSQMVVRANWLFCESTVSSSYATLVCGRADSPGQIELCSAGRCPPRCRSRSKIMGPPGL